MKYIYIYIFNAECSIDTLLSNVYMAVWLSDFENANLDRLYAVAILQMSQIFQNVNFIEKKTPQEVRRVDVDLGSSISVYLTRMDEEQQ